MFADVKRNADGRTAPVCLTPLPTNWSLTTLQQRLVKTGGRLVKHALYPRLLLAESHLTRRLFGAMLGRIAAAALARWVGKPTN